MRVSLINTVIFILIVAALLVQMAGFMNGLDWGCDYGGYVIQAKTLVSGNFDALKDNMSRNDFILNYPWGFPALLVPVIKTFERDVVFIKVYVFLFFILSLVVVYALFRQEKGYALLSLLFLACSPYFWYFKNYLFSDFPNLLFNMLSLLLIKELVIERKRLVNVYVGNGLLGLCIFLSFTMRTQSLMLLFTLAAMQLLHYKRDLLRPRFLITALIPYVVFFFLAVLIRVIIPVAPVSYLEAYHTDSLVKLIWENLLYYTNTWKELFHEIRDLNALDGIIAGVWLLLAFIGMTVKWRENLLYIVFCLCSVAPLIIAPFYQGLRYLIPVIPVLFYFFISGTFYVSTTLYKQRGKALAWLLIGGLCVFSFRSNALMSYENYKTPMNMEGPYLPSSEQLFKFIKTRTAQNDLIGFWKPRAMLLYSGRNSIVPHSYVECLERNAAYYVYYSHASYDQIALDSLVSKPKQFQAVFENADFKVFKVLQDAMFNLPKEISQVQPDSAGELSVTINYAYFDKEIIFDKEKFIPLWSNTPIQSKAFSLMKGKYILSVYSKGTQAGGEFALNKISVNDQDIGIYYSEERPTRKSFRFAVDKDTSVTLTLKLENDYRNEKEDRNTLIYFINIHKAK